MTNLKKNKTRAEIQQSLLSQFSLLVDVFTVKLSVKNYDSRILRLMNLIPGHKTFLKIFLSLLERMCETYLERQQARNCGNYLTTRPVWTGFKIAVKLKLLSHNNTRRMEGWKNVKAGLRIAYSNQQMH